MPSERAGGAATRASRSCNIAWPTSITCVSPVRFLRGEAAVVRAAPRRRYRIWKIRSPPERSEAAPGEREEIHPKIGEPRPFDVVTELRRRRRGKERAVPSERTGGASNARKPRLRHRVVDIHYVCINGEVLER